MIQDNNNKKIAAILIQDELFDLTLYRRLEKMTEGDLHLMLLELIRIEEQHLAFWKKFFGSHLDTMSFGRMIKYYAIVNFCRIGRASAIHLVLEAIEIYGIRKYLTLWRSYQGSALSEAIQGVLRDELGHEEKIVAGVRARKINPERIRNIFLGLNDGLTEIIGALGGFFAAFRDISSILIAGCTVAVAGALSMAAGSYIAVSSEREVKKMEVEKELFLSGRKTSPRMLESPIYAAMIVGGAYIFGAVIPLLPIFFGSDNIIYPVIAAAGVLLIISSILSFLSGMHTGRRILTNIIIMGIAVVTTYSIGLLAKTFFGISVS